MSSLPRIYWTRDDELVYFEEGRVSAFPFTNAQVQGGLLTRQGVKQKHSRWSRISRKVALVKFPNLF